MRTDCKLTKKRFVGLFFSCHPKYYPFTCKIFNDCFKKNRAGNPVGLGIQIRPFCLFNRQLSVEVSRCRKKRLSSFVNNSLLNFSVNNIEMLPGKSTSCVFISN